MLKITAGAISTSPVPRTVGEGDGSFTLLLKPPTFAERLDHMASEVASLLAPEKKSAHFQHMLGFVAGWDGVCDTQGQPVPFSRQTLELAVAANPQLAYGAVNCIRTFLGERLSPETSGN